MTTSMEPQQDITLAEIYLTPLMAYRRTSPIVAVSRTDYTAYVNNTTLRTHLGLFARCLHSGFI